MKIFDLNLVGKLLIFSLIMTVLTCFLGLVIGNEDAAN